MIYDSCLDIKEIGKETTGKLVSRLIVVNPFLRLIIKLYYEKKRRTSLCTSFTLISE